MPHRLTNGVPLIRVVAAFIKVLMDRSTSFSPLRFLVQVAFLLAVALPSAAMGVLDQTTGLTTGGAGLAISSRQRVAQSFTVGLDGVLGQIDIQVFRQAGANGNLSVTLLPVIGGLPEEANPLFSSVIENANVPDTPGSWASLDVSSAGVAVSAGDEFAILLTRTGPPEPGFPGDPPWLIWSEAAGLYEAGRSFSAQGGGALNAVQSGHTDLRFQTLVIVPEPNVALLLGLGLSVLSRRQRKRGAAEGCEYER